MRSILLSLTLMAMATSFAQTPCVNGFAGPYPCERIDMQAMIPLASLDNAPGLNDVWGWTDPLDGSEYALVGMLDGTAFVDISDPVNPVYLGELPTHTGSNNTWRDIKVYSDYAFIVSEQNGHGMQVFDLTRLRDVSSPPVAFTEDAHYDGFGNSHNIAMNESTGYAYPIGTSLYSGGPHFINVSDPLNPVLEGGYSAAGYSHDAQIVTYNGPDADYVGREIYIGFNGNNSEGLVLVDITDKSDPELIDQEGYDCQDYTHQGWITPDHRFCFVNDELDEGTYNYNTRTRIFNIEDLDNPFLLGNYQADVSSTDHNLYTRGSYAYMSNYTSGLRVVDFSLLDNNIMEEVAFFDVHPSDNNSGYSGTWSNYPYFESGNIVVTHRTTGLFIVKLQDMTGVVPTQLINTEICPAELSVDELNTGISGISPNPSNGLFLVEFEDELEVTQLNVTDLTGRILYLDNAPQRIEGQMRLDLSSFSKGIYLLRVNEGPATRLIIN